MKKKSIIIFIITILFLGLLKINSNATFSSTDVTVNSGENVSITVKSSEDVESYDLSLTSYDGLTYKSCSSSNAAAVVNSSGGKISFASTTGVKTLGTFNFTAPTVATTTTYSVVFDIDGTSNTATVTVKAPTSSGESGGESSGGSSSSETPKTTPTPTPAPNFTKADKTMYTKQEVRLRSDYATTNGAIMVPQGTEVKVIATSSDTYNGNIWYKVSYEGQTRYVAKSYLTETKPDDTEEEKDEAKANLKKIEITGVKLDPEFSSDVTEYTAKINNYNEKEIHIVAEAENEDAKVTIEGDKDIKVGENTITITVTIDDITKTYTVKLTNEESDVFGLSSLVIKDVDLKGFKPDVYEYKIDFKDLDKLEIEAKASEEDATVEIIGNENLKNGENIITIIVRSKDGEMVVTYQIKANKTLSVKDIVKGFSKKQIAISAAIAVVALIIIIVLIVRYVKHKHDGDDYDPDDDNDNYDVNNYKVSDYTSLDSFEENDGKKDTYIEHDAENDIEDDEEYNNEDENNIEDIRKDEFKKDTEYNVFNDVEEDEDIANAPRKYSVDDLFKSYDENDNDFYDDIPSKRRGKGKHSK